MKEEYPLSQNGRLGSQTGSDPDISVPESVLELEAWNALSMRQVMA